MDELITNTQYKLRNNNKSGYKGVYLDKKQNKWKAVITYNNKKIIIGHFYKLIDAINAYDNKAIELLGTKALTNARLIELGIAKRPMNNLDIIPNIIEDLPNEIWRNIVGYEGDYQVSNMGRVKSFDRKVEIRNSFKLIKGVILRPGICRGYYFVHLSKKKITKNHRVNRLVALAFLPNPNKLAQVNHKDMNKLNNKVDNLEWCDHLYNQRHARANRIFVKPIGNRKINELQAKEIKDLWKTGETTKNLGIKFNLKQNTIYYIVSNRRWKDVV